MSSFERGEIWFADHDPIREREQVGDRPTLIISDTRFNQGPAGLVIACPLTTTRRNLASRVHVPEGEGGLTKDSYVICEGVRSMSKQRFRRPLGKVQPQTLVAVEERLRFLMQL